MSIELTPSARDAIQSADSHRDDIKPLIDDALSALHDQSKSKIPLTTSRVLFAVTELYPYVKTGGLGDVAASLPISLKKQGVDVRYFLPGYTAIKNNFKQQKIVRAFATYFGVPNVRLLFGVLPNGMQAYVLDAPSLYERPHPYLQTSKEDWDDNHIRFGAFCYAAAYLNDYDTTWQADIIHGNDWHCGLIPAYRKLYKMSPRVVTIMTIHNICYQGIFPSCMRDELMLPEEGFSSSGYEFYGKIGFLKAGIYYSDHITAVSQTYAHEIASSSKGCGLEGLLRARSHDITGVLNGIDKLAWNPANDTLIASQFSAKRLDKRKKNKSAFLEEIGFTGRDTMPLFAFVGRLTPQKGVDLLLEAIQPLLKDDISFVVMGNGDDNLEKQCKTLADRYPDRVAHLKCEEGLEHRLYAGADAVIVPSHFEPCGLVQLYAARYGALPIVRKTGGLADTISQDRGFIFDPPTVMALRRAILHAKQVFTDMPDIWRTMQKATMNEDFGWQKASLRYAKIYNDCLNRKHKTFQA